MKRVLTALALVPFALYSVLWAPWWVFFAAVLLMSGLCFHEYCSITKSFAPLGFVSGIFFLLLPQHDLGILLILTALAVMCVPLPADDLQPAMHRAAMLLMGILYVFGSWKAAILLHDISAYWLLFALVINWVGDTGAYYVGKNFGRTKLAPIVSPGKTWEGTLGGAALAVVFGCFFVPWAIPGTAWWLGGLLALLGNAAGQLGDLAESALKRGAGVKDSGTLLPGHGGVLDRLDSSLFSIPVVLALVNLLR